VIQLPEKSGKTAGGQQEVRFVQVSEEEAGQRLDNFLLRFLSGVPKTRIYKAIRKGEVRVNKGRAKPETRLQGDDRVRVPPFHEAVKSKPAASRRWIDTINSRILLDEDDLLVINKPSGLAVHGGSGIDAGLIETLRLMYPEQRYMELVHRLDRDTSGLIMVARRASMLRALHELLRNDGIDKRYQCLVLGRWPAHLKQVEAPLEKYALGSGERMVKVSGDGKSSLTQFRVLHRWREATLVEAKPVTGRTHQIRVHCRHVGHPILGDVKYQTPEAAVLADRIGLGRLFLHAAELQFKLVKRYKLGAPLDDELQQVLTRLTQAS